MSRTGLRLGEALALRSEDLDLEAREPRVERALTSAGDIDTPKSSHGRTVDLSASACAVLRHLRARAGEAALKAGAQPVAWVLSVMRTNPSGRGSKRSCAIGGRST